MSPEDQHRFAQVMGASHFPHGPMSLKTGQELVVTALTWLEINGYELMKREAEK